MSVHAFILRRLASHLCDQKLCHCIDIYSQYTYFHRILLFPQMFTSVWSPDFLFQQTEQQYILYYYALQENISRKVTNLGKTFISLNIIAQKWLTLTVTPSLSRDNKNQPALLTSYLSIIYKLTASWKPYSSMRRVRPFMELGLKF